MNIIFNGEQRDVSGAVTVADFLAQLEVRSDQVAVEVNFELIPRENHATHLLAAGDQLEVVTLVGGG